MTQTPDPRPTSRPRGYVLLLCAATSYGSQGVFYTLIGNCYGASVSTMAFLRVLVAFAALAVGLTALRRDLLAIRWRELPLLLATGVFGYAAFYLVYTKAVMVAGVSTAAVLQYTAPIWVCLFAWRFLGEGFGVRKGLALLGALVGVAAVAQAYDPARVRLNGVALAWGLGAGICACGYILLNRYAVRRHSPLTVTFYAQASAIMVLALFTRPLEVWRAAVVPGAIWWYLAVGLVSGLIGAVLWPAGLQRLGASTSSILGAWEPVTALLLAFVVLGERLEPLQWLGAAIVLGGIVLLTTGDIVKTRTDAKSRCGRSGRDHVGLEPD